MAWLAVCSVSAAVILSHATYGVIATAIVAPAGSSQGVQWSVSPTVRLMRARGRIRLSGPPFPGHR